MKSPASPKKLRQTKTIPSSAVVPDNLINKEIFPYPKSGDHFKLEFMSEIHAEIRGPSLLPALSWFRGEKETNLEV